MNLEEEEQQLIREIEFFNRNIEWWSSEFQKANKEFNKIEKNFFTGVSSDYMDNLVAKLTYLAGKANVEKKTAEEIDKKIKKLELKKELQFIQGDILPEGFSLRIKENSLTKRRRRRKK